MTQEERATDGFPTRIFVLQVCAHVQILGGFPPVFGFKACGQWRIARLSNKRPMWSSWASVHWGYSPRSGCSSASLAVVNGHSYKEKKFENTNLAILCSHDFREPFDRSTTYAQKIGELANMLGDGRILVQRFGDILDGKRTW